jgi:hypothetical protein
MPYNCVPSLLWRNGEASRVEREQKSLVKMVASPAGEWWNRFSTQNFENKKRESKQKMQLDGNSIEKVKAIMPPHDDDATQLAYVYLMLYIRHRHRVHNSVFSIPFYYSYVWECKMQSSYFSPRLYTKRTSSFSYSLSPILAVFLLFMYILCERFLVGRRFVYTHENIEKNIKCIRSGHFNLTMGNHFAFMNDTCAFWWRNDGRNL